MRSQSKTRIGSSAEPRARAFTLVDVVVTIVIVAVFSVIAVPRVENFLARQRIEGAARRITVELAFAQQRAKESGVAVTARFNVIASRYELVGAANRDRSLVGYQVELADEPYGVKIMTANFGGDGDVIFDAFGVPDSGGSVVIQLGSFTRTITVDGNNIATILAV